MDINQSKCEHDWTIKAEKTGSEYGEESARYAYGELYRVCTKCGLILGYDRNKDLETTLKEYLEFTSKYTN